MKSFDEFKTIAYKGAVSHAVHSQGKQKQIPKGKAVPVRSRSSAGGGSDGSGSDGSGGDGGE